MLEEIKAIEGYDEIEKKFHSGEMDLSCALSILSDKAFKSDKEYNIFYRLKGHRCWVKLTTITGCSEAYEYAETHATSGYEYKIEEAKR